MCGRTTRVNDRDGNALGAKRLGEEMVVGRNDLEPSDSRLTVINSPGISVGTCITLILILDHSHFFVTVDFTYPGVFFFFFFFSLCKNQL